MEEEPAKKEKKKEKKTKRQRKDWGQAEAEKLSFTLANKQGGSERSIHQQY